MIHKIREGYIRAAARGHLPEHQIDRATLATVMEAGIVAFHKAYFGLPEWSRVQSDVKANRQAYETAAFLQEGLLTDLTRVRRDLREANTSSDLPYILGDIRNRVVYGTLNPVTSHFWEIAQQRVATDFKFMRSYRVNPAQELVSRAEGEDVEMSTISMTAQGYSIVNYERGILLTWENWKNDELGIFQIAMQNMGIAAQRTRAKVALNAIASGLSRTNLSDISISGWSPSVGGPTIDNLVAAQQVLATTVDANGQAMGFTATDIAYPAIWEIQANQSLKSATVLGPVSTPAPSANPVFGLANPHNERIMAEVLGSDWLLWDATYPFIERAVLDEFAGGPLTYTQLPDVVEHVDQGTFMNHTIGVKIGDAVAANIITTLPVVRVKGS